MKCPNCEGTVWVSEYLADCQQPAIVAQADDGHIYVSYEEPAVIIEECGNTSLRCRGCNYTLDARQFTEV